MKILIALSLILILVGSIGAQQAQAPLTFPDVDTPAAAQGVALDAWKNAVQADLNDHEIRLRKLEAILTAQPAPPASTTFSIPVVSGAPPPQTCGTPPAVCNTVSGQVLSYSLSLPANTYTLSVTGVGDGTIEIVVNGVPSGVLLNFPAAQAATSTGTVHWPGGSGSIALLYRAAWVNLQGNLTLQ